MGSSLPSVEDTKKKPAFEINDNYDDDFDNYGGEEEDDDDGDFDANELLNLGDYQNKRRLGDPEPLATKVEEPK